MRLIEMQILLFFQFVKIMRSLPQTLSYFMCGRVLKAGVIPISRPCHIKLSIEQWPVRLVLCFERIKQKKHHISVGALEL